MSAAATALAWEKIKGGQVSGVAALVLLKLADRADDDGLCWPGHKRTADDCNINVRTARRSIASLQASGLLRQEARKGTGKNGADQSNRYYVGVAREEGSRPSSPGGRKTHPPMGNTPSSWGAINPPPDGRKAHQNLPDESNNLNLSPQPPQPTAAPRGGGDREMDNLVWPAGLTSELLSSAQKVLLGSGWPGLSAAQALVDELAGVMAQGNVRNHVGLLRKLRQCQLDGEFTPELGPAIRDIREARRRHDEWLSRSEAAPAAAPQQPTAPVEDSEVVRHHRELLRQKRASWHK